MKKFIIDPIFCSIIILIIGISQICIARVTSKAFFIQECSSLNKPAIAIFVDDTSIISIGFRKAGILLPDTIAPSVLSVSSTVSDYLFCSGSLIEIIITFSEEVIVTGTPSLLLNTGGVARYISGSGSSILTFNYLVLSGQGCDFNDFDIYCEFLEYIDTNSLDISGATIRDVAGNNAILTLPSVFSANSLTGNTRILIDGISPVVIFVDATTSRGIYGQGSIIQIEVYFSEAIHVTGFGTPSLLLNTGGVAEYESLGPHRLYFHYAVAPDQGCDYLEYVDTNSLIIPTGVSIADDAGNTAVFTLPPVNSPNSLSGRSFIIVDAIKPTILSISSTNKDGIYKIGDTIALTVNFSEPVILYGDYSLEMNSGGLATLSSAQASNIQILNYIVGSGQSSADLNYSGFFPWLISDMIGNVGYGLMPSDGSGNSLGDQKNIVIDGIAPNVCINSAVDSLTYISPLPVSITFSEIVTGFEQNDITVTNGTVYNFMGNGTTYSANIIPTGQGLVSIDIADSIAIDIAGNSNANANKWSINYMTGYIITGNTGIDGVILSYTDGTPKTVISDNTGAYLISVPAGWSGVVIPAKAGYFFVPAIINYSNVLENLSNQDYATIATNMELLHSEPVRCVIYPTLVNGSLKIDMIRPEIGSVNVRLINSAGVPISEFIYQKASIHALFNVDLNYVPAGIYLVKIYMNSFCEIKKICIQK